MACGNLRDLPSIADQVQCHTLPQHATQYSQRGKVNAICASIKTSSQTATPTASISFPFCCGIHSSVRLLPLLAAASAAPSSFNCTIKSKSARLLGMQRFFFTTRKRQLRKHGKGGEEREGERGREACSERERERKSDRDRREGQRGRKQASPTKPALSCAATQYPGTSDMCSQPLVQFGTCEANQKVCIVCCRKRVCPTRHGKCDST